MEILLRSVQIFDPSSRFHLKTKNILIKNGVIAAIGGQNLSGKREIRAQKAWLSPGWFDFRVSFGDPGHEYKEDMNSGRAAAAAGGFTAVGLLPNTNPVIQSKNEISYVRSGNAHNLTQIYPYAAVTKDTAGKELTEMIDLHHAGAAAFTDGIAPIWHTDIFVKTLLYLQKFNGLLINRPEDKLLTTSGAMNEGLVSTILGLKGMPAIAEELMIDRDLSLLKYVGGRVHFSNLSTAKSVGMIREAKKQGLAVTCDVAAHQLVFDQSELEGFDTNYKVNPPFRSKADIKALLKGLQDDTIDVITSDHRPQDEESKKLEFDRADFGMIGLQTVLPLINRLTPKLPMEKWLPKLIQTPREILGLPVPEIKEGAPANLTLFDAEQEWTFDASTNYSKSDNSPLFGQNLKGKVLAVFNQGKHWLGKQ